MIKRSAARPVSSGSWILVTIVAGIVVLSVAYVSRGMLRDAYRRFTAPKLPVEQAYQPTIVHPGQATSTTSQTPSKPSKAEGEPEPSSDLPREKRLAVPFTSQAPHANWDDVHNETCEEASVLMVRAYYQGTKGVIAPDAAETELQTLLTIGEGLGFSVDTTAAQTAKLMEVYDATLQAEVVPYVDAEQIKRYIAQGIPVIIPADGKALPNPNFRNGGPRYHMLVVRGYTEDQFITNDPGTRLGENFLYSYDGLLDAIHDWNDGDVPNGERVILIVKPR